MKNLIIIIIIAIDKSFEIIMSMLSVKGIIDVIKWFCSDWKNREEKKILCYKNFKCLLVMNKKLVAMEN